MKKKTVLYARNSISSQEHSIETQKNYALRKAQLNGCVFDDLYFDESVSARKTEIHERPQLKRLVEDIKNDRIATIYVFARDRLARNAAQARELRELFRTKKVNVVFTSDHESSMIDGVFSNMYESFLSHINEVEGDRIAHQIKSTKLSMISQGKHPQGPVPYGYTVDNEKRYQINEVQANIILKLYNAIIDTQCETYADFIREMQRTPWFPKEWDYPRVISLLRNTFYKGYRHTSTGNGSMNYHPAIVDDLTWSKAQDRLNDLKQNRQQANMRVAMMLDGLLYCRKCGRAMIGRQHTTTASIPYYTCANHSYIQLIPETIEETVMIECANHLTSRFQSCYPELFKIVNQDLIQSCQKTLAAIIRDLPYFKQRLYDETARWLNNPQPELAEELVHLQDCIKRDELIQQYYLFRLAQLQQEARSMEQLQASVDLKTEVLSYSSNERKLFIHNVVERINYESKRLELRLRDPFKVRGDFQ